MIIQKIPRLAKEAFLSSERTLYNRLRKAKLKNANFTIISSNCIGGVMYKDLGLPYLSPTANLSIPVKDFVKMAADLPYYMAQPLRPLETESGPPKALLGDVTINFVHYASYEQGAAKWQRRVERINWDNIFLVSCDRDGGTYEVMEQFSRLPYPKVFFTYKPYPEVPCAFSIPGFEARGELGDVTAYKPGPLRRRHMDAFDYVGFLNGNIAGGTSCKKS